MCHRASKAVWINKTFQTCFPIDPYIPRSHLHSSSHHQLSRSLVQLRFSCIIRTIRIPCLIFSPHPPLPLVPKSTVWGLPARNNLPLTHLTISLVIIQSTLPVPTDPIHVNSSETWRSLRLRKISQLFSSKYALIITELYHNCGHRSSQIGNIPKKTKRIPSFS